MSSEPHPSGTVVVVRDAEGDLELLLLQRAPRSDGRPGPWVFPGGKVDPSDGDVARDPVGGGGGAAGEALEEAAVELSAGELVSISRWITPEISPKRFDTWFFLAEAHSPAVRVDGSEICDHRWLSPRAALDAHHAGGLRLAPPTFVTVSWLLDRATPSEARAHLGGRSLPPFRPHICRLEDGACMLYPGDAGYAAHDPRRDGPRHRLWTLPDGWRYECDAMGS
jgi:8-oxo-dGTP pyrophosphatase MutT (NUDIX family)